MQIRVVNVGTPTLQGKLVKLPVKYEANGTEKERTLVSIGKTKDVIEILKSATAGDIFDIKLEKDGQYWNWTEATWIEGSPLPKASSLQGQQTNTQTSRFESPEERAFRQELIVRQNSVTNAVAYYAMCNFKNKPTPQEVVAIARTFEDYVFGRELQELTIPEEYTEEDDGGDGG